jgi:hypothetical protein
VDVYVVVNVVVVVPVVVWACPSLVDTRFQPARSNSMGLR